MARVKLELPDTFQFITDLSVRISDINYGNHLGNDAVLRLIHEARVRFLDQLGYKELAIEGVGMVIADAVIMYRSQSYYADRLRVYVAVDEFNRNGCDMYYRIVNTKTDREVARAKTGIVFLDYENNKITRLPDAFKRKILDLTKV
jgi:acyl-CoA thioesterase FadM